MPVKVPATRRGSSQDHANITSGLWLPEVSVFYLGVVRRLVVSSILIAVAACGNTVTKPSKPGGGSGSGSSDEALPTWVPRVPLPKDLPDTPGCLAFLANGNGALVWTQRNTRINPQTDKTTRTLRFVMVEDRPPPVNLWLEFDDEGLEDVWEKTRKRLDAQLAKVGLVPCVEVPNNSGDAWSYSAGEKRITVKAVWEDTPPDNEDEDPSNDRGLDGRIRLFINGRARDIAQLYAAPIDQGDHESLEQVMRDPRGRTMIIMIANDNDGLRSERAVVIRP
jgi:hypothetical protein